jgi:hypothetical protein
LRYGAGSAAASVSGTADTISSSTSFSVVSAIARSPTDAAHHAEVEFG